VLVVAEDLVRGAIIEHRQGVDPAQDGARQRQLLGGAAAGLDALEALLQSPPDGRRQRLADSCWILEIGHSPRVRVDSFLSRDKHGSSSLPDADGAPPVIEGPSVDRNCVESITTPRGAMDDDRVPREERFTCLYDAYYSDVRAYAWRRGPDTADDVVAETFTTAWQRLDSLPAEPLPWLIGVARNVLLNLQRGERRRREREMRCAESDVTPSFAGAIEARSSLGAALQTLPERDREILLLAAWERLDRPGLAAVLGCTKATVAVRLFRARKRLAAALADAEARPGIVTADSRGRLPDEC